MLFLELCISDPFLPHQSDQHQALSSDLNVTFHTAVSGLIGQHALYAEIEICVKNYIYIVFLAKCQVYQGHYVFSVRVRSRHLKRAPNYTALQSPKMATATFSNEQSCLPALQSKIVILGIVQYAHR